MVLQTSDIVRFSSVQSVDAAICAGDEKGKINDKQHDATFLAMQYLEVSTPANAVRQTSWEERIGEHRSKYLCEEEHNLNENTS